MDFHIAPLDKYAERITMGVAYLGGLLTLPLLFAYLSNTRWYGLFIPVGFAIVLAIFILLTYAAQPIRYTIGADELMIRRRWMKAIKIPLSEITATSLATTLSDVQRIRLRFAFNPGLFGYQGPFHLEKYGKVFFLATNCSKLVAVARGPIPPLIISPNNPQAFVAALREKLIMVEKPLDENEQEGA